MHTYNKIYTLALVSLLTACGGKSDNNANALDQLEQLGQLDQLEQLEQSLQTWSAARDAHAGNYRYESNFVSWVGSGWVATLYVADNSVYRRSYQAFDENRLPTDRYDEDEATLGTNSTGSEVATIDELYDQCREILNTQSPDDNYITLALSDEGFISTCTYHPKDCADDCALGVMLNNIQLGSLEYLQNENELALLERSLQTWSAARVAHAGNYRYESDFVSWVGFGWVTTLYVADNSVYRRTYQAFGENRLPTDSYDEDETSLGTNIAGSRVATIDELYDQCREILNTQSPDDNYITLALSDEGFISTCTYYPKDCADDCALGVWVNNILLE